MLLHTVATSLAWRHTSSAQLPACHSPCLECQPPHSSFLECSVPSLPDCTPIKMWTDSTHEDCLTPPDQVSSLCSGLPCGSMSLSQPLPLHFIPVPLRGQSPRERIIVLFSQPQNWKGPGNRNAKLTCWVQFPTLSLHPGSLPQHHSLQRGHIPPTGVAHLG